MTRNRCSECFALGSHFHDCSRAIAGGHSMSRKSKQRTEADKRRWAANKLRALERDGQCQWEGCFAVRGLHPHHVETVQECQARGLPWWRIDHIDNVRCVCFRHHGVVHSAAGLDEAIRQGLRIPPRHYQPTKD